MELKLHPSLGKADAKVYSRYTGELLFDLATTPEIEGLVRKGASFENADLSSLHLAELDLRGANFRNALCRGTNFSNSDLRGACFRGANLVGAMFYGTRLESIDMRGAKIDQHFLKVVRNDVWAVCSSQPHQVENLLAAIKEGKIQNSIFMGDRINLAGTLETVAFSFAGIPGLDPNIGRLAEIWFLRIGPGETPASGNRNAVMAAIWIEEWLMKIKAAFPKNR